MTVSAPSRQLKQNDTKLNQRIRQRLKLNRILKYVLLGCTLVGLLVLAVLIIDTLIKGTSHLNLHFLTSFSSSTPSMAGIKGALVGTLWLMVTIIPISIILGVGTAIYLEEYARDNTFTRIIKISISNLAGVPSVVFGLLGLTIFVRGMGIEALGLGNSIIAAALTMSLLILPIIIVASQEAIRAVPQAMRDASYGLGATQWQTIRRVVLPAALPGILTGFILALSRALGETAPLILIGIPTVLLSLPSSIFDQFQALPMQIYNWAKLPQAEFQNVASAGIIVLLIILLLMNAIAIFLRNKFSKKF
ncbi:phosphate ABC transporter permease PstA [Staphylococcus pettenkoferi]|uniref:Phosphate transport system permease protein PstA n=1 Tax=Staphylococcus pettenkoferi TaxID=170573 RepID=A0A9Q4GZU3_9STAP|nr:phosphate ABC transporter permease PstA [Staphylococcus pettenkoferi]MCY1568171.1 phosphate ABC transporter permease PstA [Staphylococcus pettenkoferi]MCY1575297.1 phosphate ABC transporter permease PstA [Staphylococcus pettenkoferi]MCY1594942.1 phosphate ABC transporter permease PstA [Staphylococcus pettenkoferi]MCY1618295.1 phosphate ABC transporter permease PstA [Staphylococcus pettenkoferi]